MKRYLWSGFVTVWAAVIIFVLGRQMWDEMTLEADTIVHAGPLDLLILPDSTPVRVLEGGRSAALAFVTMRCRYCMERKGDIIDFLNKMPADDRYVVSVDGPQPAIVYGEFDGIRATMTVAERTDDLARFNIRQFPALLVVDARGEVVLADAGVPPRIHQMRARRTLRKTLQ